MPPSTVDPDQDDQLKHLSEQEEQPKTPAELLERIPTMSDDEAGMVRPTGKKLRGSFSMNARPQMRKNKPSVGREESEGLENDSLIGDDTPDVGLFDNGPGESLPGRPGRGSRSGDRRRPGIRSPLPSRRSPGSEPDEEDETPGESTRARPSDGNNDQTAREPGDGVYDDRGNEDSEPPSSAGEPDREELNEAEENPEDVSGSASKKSAGKEEVAGLAVGEDSLYKPSFNKQEARRWRFNKRRAALGGGLLGTLVGIIFFFSLSSGPLQFIHIAQLMEQFHFATQERQSDERGLKLMQDIHYASMGNIEKTRLGYIGNHYADKIEARFNDSGIETAYTKALGFRNGFVIDPEKFSGNGPFGDLNSMSEEEIKTYFKDNFGAEVKTNLKGLTGRKFFVSTDGLNYRQNGALTNAAVKEAGISKKFSWISARIMGERAGVTWHPIKKLDNKILKTAEDRFLKWKSQEAQTIDEGTSTDITLTDQPQTDKNATDAQKTQAGNNATSAHDSTNSIKDAGNSAGEQVLTGDETAVPKFTQSLKFKLGAGGVAAAGVACMARGLGENINSMKTLQVILPLIRYGVQFMALGAQVMSGQGVDPEQLGFFAQFLSGKNAAGQNTSAFDAKSIEQNLGKSPTGPAAPSTLSSINSGNPFNVFLTGTLGSILGPVCSKTGQDVQLVLSFLGGPISALTGAVIGAAVGPTLMNTMAHWFAHDAVNVFAKGSDAGYNIDYGTALAANGQALSAGGRALSSSEVAVLDSTTNSYYRQDFQSKNLAYKLFDPYDQRTVVSKLIDASTNSFTTNVAKMGSFMLNFSHAFSAIGSLFSPHVQAASQPYDYGFPIVGFSASEMSNPLVSNPYKNADQVVNTILPAHPDYIKRAQKCFNVTIDPTTYDITSWGGQGDMPQYNSTSQGFEGSDCSDQSSEWLQVRFYIFDSQTAESASCYYGDDTDCARVGFGSGSASGSNDSGSGASSGSSSGAPGSLPTGSAADLAKQLEPYISKGAIQCTGDGAHDLGCSDIMNTANGISIRGGSCQADGLAPGLLGMLLELVKMGHTFTLSALCSDHSTLDGLGGHNGGRAADFNTIDGVFMGPSATAAWTPQKNQAAQKLDQDIASFMPKSTGFGQVQCHPAYSFLDGFSTFNDSCHHQHVQVEI